MRTNPVLVVMAAGASRRFGRPKQLETVGPNGETLLEYAAFDALRAGCGGVVLVVRPETERQFRDRLDPGLGEHTDLAYVHQTLSARSTPLSISASRAKPWGTAHAVLSARPAVRGPFAVLNADDFYGTESLASLFGHLRRQATGAPPVHAVVGFEVGKTLSTAGAVSRALCRADDRGRLVDIVEIPRIWGTREGIRYRDSEGVERSLDGTALVSMNLWGFFPEIFDLLERSFTRFLETHGASDDAELLLPEVIRSAVLTGVAEVEVLRSTAEWCGLTHAGDLPRVREVIRDQVRAGRYPERLWG